MPKVTRPTASTHQIPTAMAASSSRPTSGWSAADNEENLRRAPVPAPTAHSAARAASTWSATDDETLMSARASGLNWQPISQRHFPNKTANACRKRHERLMERRNADDWDGPKLEALASEYMAVRQEMWTILGQRLGEKWGLVEQKCMEKGLKNLQAAHRSAQRKERGIYEGDSGIGVSDAENDTDDGPSTARPVGPVSYSPGGYHAPDSRGNMSIHTMLSPSPGHQS